MATQSITIARIYLREGEHLLANIVNTLHDEEKISGVTVLQGTEGFGADGKIRTSHLIDLSLDLPLIIEFYDEPERVAHAVKLLKNRLNLAHIVSWQAERYI